MSAQWRNEITSKKRETCKHKMEMFEQTKDAAYKMCDEMMKGNEEHMKDLQLDFAERIWQAAWLLESEYAHSVLPQYWKTMMYKWMPTQTHKRQVHVTIVHQ